MGIPDGRRTKSKKQNSRGKEHFQGLEGRRFGATEHEV